MSRTVSGKEVFTTLDERVDPAHTCLLVVDVQNDFCSAGGAADRHKREISGLQAIIPSLSRLINRARAAGVPIINVKMTTFEDGRTYSDVDLARRIHVWNGDMLVTRYGTWGHDNPADMPFAETDVVIQKHRNNAFTGTELQQVLGKRSSNPPIQRP